MDICGPGRAPEVPGARLASQEVKPRRIPAADGFDV